MKLISTKKYLIEILIGFLFIFLFSFSLLLPALKKTSVKYTHNNLVSVANLNFKIPSPSEEQIKIIGEMSSVDKVYPFFDTFTSLKIGEKQLSNQYVLIVPSQYIKDFPFVNKKLLVNGSMENSSGGLFVDYSFAKANKISVGDKVDVQIGSKNETMEISGVVNNFGDLLSSEEIQKNVSVLFIDINKFYSYVGKNISYSGAYIRCTDSESFKNYLDSYKPYGRLKNRSTFDSEQKYKEYLDYFNNGQYGTEILNFELVNKLDNSSTNILLSGIYCGLVSILLLILFILITNDKDLVYNSQICVQNGEEISSILKKLKSLLRAVQVISLIEVCILFLMFTKLSSFYNSLNSLIPVILLVVFVPLILSVLFIALNLKIHENRCNKFVISAKKELSKNFGNAEIEAGYKWKNGEPVYIKIIYSYSINDNSGISVSKLNIDNLIYCSKLTVGLSCENIQECLKKQKQSKTNETIKITDDHSYLIVDELNNEPLILEYTKKKDALSC